MDYGYLAVKAVFPVDKGGKCCDDPIVAAYCIVVESDKDTASQV